LVLIAVACFRFPFSAFREERRMRNARLLRTTVPVCAITPKLPSWAGPVRVAAPAGPLTTSAHAAAPLGIKWPDALGD
jgi:hypothetical protein